MATDYSAVDQAKVWMYYFAFNGDIDKTAISTHVSVKVIQALEHDFNWPAKLKSMRVGSGETGAERTANRVVNYLQAQRLRDVLDRTLTLLQDEEELIRMISKVHMIKDVLDYVEVNPKAVLELSKALESVHNMSYRALGDKLPAAADPVDAESRTSATGMDQVRNVIDALSALSKKPVAPVVVLEAVMAPAPAQVVVAEAIPPAA